MRIERYGIYLVNLDPTIGSEIRKTRPAIVVSADAMNRRLSTIVICPLTTTLHPKWRNRIQLPCAGQDAEIAVDQIRCLSTKRILKKLDKAHPATAKQLRDTIAEMYAE
ncbi:MAG: type II toxin-antitoxin system PemK/MazF family toxin [Verrucomicrobiota bacterium]